MVMRTTRARSRSKSPSTTTTTRRIPTSSLSALTIIPENLSLSSDDQMSSSNASSSSSTVATVTATGAPVPKKGRNTATSQAAAASSSSRTSRAEINDDWDANQKVLQSWRLARMFNFHEAACPSSGRGNNRMCIDMPNCHHSMGKGKKGTIWDKTPPQFRDLGPDFSARVRQPDSFAGLRNLGATCYLNTMTQSLYMNHTFRDAVFRFDYTLAKRMISERKDDDTTSSTACDVLQQLQRVFGGMLKSDQAYVDPTDLVTCLGLSKSEQQDVQEFNALFLSMIERAFKLTHNDDLLAAVHQFTGKLLATTTCEVCNEKSERSEDTNELSMQISGMRTIQQCLAAYFKHEHLTGGNQFRCTPCGKKVDANIQRKYSKAPKVLHLQLMRFQFDSKTYRKKKLQDNISIPHKLDMSAYIVGAKEGKRQPVSGSELKRNPSGGRHSPIPIDQHTSPSSSSSSAAPSSDNERSSSPEYVYYESGSDAIKRDVTAKATSRGNGNGNGNDAHNHNHIPKITSVDLAKKPPTTLLGFYQRERREFLRQDYGTDAAANKVSKVEWSTLSDEEKELWTMCMKTSIDAHQQYKVKTASLSATSTTARSRSPKGHNQSSISSDVTMNVNEDETTVTWGSHVYELIAVLRHKGTSAYHGHYVADIKDEAKGKWWHFDDTKVTCLGDHFNLAGQGEDDEFNINGRTKKKRRLAMTGTKRRNGKKKAANDDSEAKDMEVAMAASLASSTTSSSSPTNDSTHTSGNSNSNGSSGNGNSNGITAGTSKNAYMLIYRLIDSTSPSTPRHFTVPPVIDNDIREANITFNQNLKEYRERKSELETAIEHRKSLYNIVWDKIYADPVECDDNAAIQDCRLISTSWLQRWVQGINVVREQKILKRQASKLEKSSDDTSSTPSESSSTPSPSTSTSTTMDLTDDKVDTKRNDIADSKSSKRKRTPSSSPSSSSTANDSAMVDGNNEKKIKTDSNASSNDGDGEASTMVLNDDDDDDDDDDDESDDDTSLDEKKLAAAKSLSVRDVLHPGSIIDALKDFQCSHGGADPSRVSSLRRITTIAWDLLTQDNLGDQKDVPYMSDSQLCEVCCRAKQRLNVQQNGYQENLTDQLEPWWTNRKSLPADRHHYWWNREWLTKLRTRFNQDMKKKANVDTSMIMDDVNTVIMCKHKSLCLDEKIRVLIPKSLYEILSFRLPAATLFPGHKRACEICARDAKMAQEEETAASEERDKEKKDAANLYKSPHGDFPSADKPPAAGKYYLLPSSWVADWKDYIKTSSNKPDGIPMGKFFCKHGQLQYNPIPLGDSNSEPGAAIGTPLNVMCLAKEKDWQILSSIYQPTGIPDDVVAMHASLSSSPSSSRSSRRTGASSNPSDVLSCAAGIMVEFKTPKRGKQFDWQSSEIICTPTVCPQCVSDRITSEKAKARVYRDGWVKVKQVPLTVPWPTQADNKDGNAVVADMPTSGRPKRGAAARSMKESTVRGISHDMTLETFLMKIYEEMEFPPAQVTLCVNGCQLPAGPPTRRLSEINIWNHDTILLKFDDKLPAFPVDDHVSRAPEVGFRGSVLLGGGGATTNRTASPLPLPSSSSSSSAAAAAATLASRQSSADMDVASNEQLHIRVDPPLPSSSSSSSAAPASSVSWSCGVCTLVNTNGTKCNACGALRSS